MNLLDYILIAIILLVALIRTFQMFLPHKKRKPGKIVAPWTLTLILISFYTVVFVSCIEYFLRDNEINLFVSAVGVLLIIPIRIIKNMAVKELGEYWSIHIEIRKNQPLITSGIYGYIRNPSYLTGILESIAIPLIANAWGMLLYGFTINLVVYYFRIKLEEQALMTHYGERYLDYVQEVNAFCPKMKKIRMKLLVSHRG